MMRANKVSVIGLGKLGLPMAACFADRGFEVVGVDVYPAVIRKIKTNQIPFYEPNLSALLKRNKKKLEFTTDFNAIQDSSLIFVVVPTPSKPNGEFRNDFVISAMTRIGKALRNQKTPPLIVLTSTVLPGACEREILPALKRSLNASGSDALRFCYSPEFIALGSVIRDILNPDFILIGESNSIAGAILEKFYRAICKKKPPVMRTNLVNAELAKISVNTFITTKISYANMIASICERIPGADANVVTGVLGLDSRIGPKYLRGAVSFGGPCFPRDNRAFISIARKLKSKALLPEATDRINQIRLRDLVRRVERLAPNRLRVGILGVAYKPNTSVIESSPGYLLAELLIRKGIPVVLYDNFALQEAKNIFGRKALYASSMFDCIRRSDIVILMTPDSEFRRIKPSYFDKNRRIIQIVIDCWRLLNPNNLRDRVIYETLGQFSQTRNRNAEKKR